MIRQELKKEEIDKFLSELIEAKMERAEFMLSFSSYWSFKEKKDRKSETDIEPFENH